MGQGRKESHEGCVFFGGEGLYHHEQLGRSPSEDPPRECAECVSERP